MSQQVSFIPGQTQIRAHLEIVKQKQSNTLLRYDYDAGVRDALHWVLNGGEPPATTGTVPYMKQRCRECGCTDADCSHCMKRTGKACTWVERDLCSACAEVKP